MLEPGVGEHERVAVERLAQALGINEVALAGFSRRPSMLFYELEF